MGRRPWVEEQSDERLPTGPRRFVVIGYSRRMQSSQGRTTSGRTFRIQHDFPRAVVVLLLLASFAEVRARMPCSSASDCHYAGCAHYGAEWVVPTVEGRNMGSGESCSSGFCWGDWGDWGNGWCPERICPAGTFSSVSGVCTSGGRGRGGGTECSCTACPAGASSPAGATVCVTCGAGTYWSAAEAAALADVRPFDGGGATACVACGAGTYSALTSASVCTTCPAGTYSLATGATNSTACVPCGAGAYSLAGATACVTCGAGSVLRVTGATIAACVPCGAGTYSLAGATACVTCGAGTYSNVTGATACVTCGAGTYSGLTGATNISTCLPRCPPGFYSQSSGESKFYSDTCEPCPFNFRSPIGSASVANCTCAPGFFGPAGGACTPCPSGTYKKDTGTAAACTPCPTGQWSPTQSVDAADCVERLTKVVTPRSLFMSTSNRTLPGWGNSAYTRCQLLFSWTELNKVLSFIRYNPIV